MTVTELARLCAALDAPFADTGKILAEARLSADDWAQTKRRVMAEIAERARAGDPGPSIEFREAYAASREGRAKEAAAGGSYAAPEAAAPAATAEPGSASFDPMEDEPTTLNDRSDPVVEAAPSPAIGLASPPEMPSYMRLAGRSAAAPPAPAMPSVSATGPSALGVPAAFVIAPPPIATPSTTGDAGAATDRPPADLPAHIAAARGAGASATADIPTPAVQAPPLPFQPKQTSSPPPLAASAAHVSTGTSEVATPGGAAPALPFKRYVELCIERERASSEEEAASRLQMSANERALARGYWDPRVASDPNVRAALEEMKRRLGG